MRSRLSMSTHPSARCPDWFRCQRTRKAVCRHRSSRLPELRRFSFAVSHDSKSCWCRPFRVVPDRRWPHGSFSSRGLSRTMRRFGDGRAGRSGIGARWLRRGGLRRKLWRLRCLLLRCLIESVLWCRVSLIELVIRGELPMARLGLRRWLERLTRRWTRTICLLWKWKELSG